MNSGGAPGSGGLASDGGAPGSGGVTSVGGAPGSGGIMSSGGAPGTGGVMNLGGAPGSGGIMSSGGAPGTGGVMNLGGATGAGGATQLMRCYCPSDSPTCAWMQKCEGACGTVSQARAACDCSAVCSPHGQDECYKDARCSWNIYGTSCYSINCSDNADCPDGCTKKTGMCNAFEYDVQWQLPTDPSQCPN